MTITDRPATAACAATQIALVSEGYPESYRLVAIDAAGRILWSHAQVLAGEMVSLEATAPDRIAAQFYVRGGDPTLHLHEWIVGAAGAMSYRVERRDAVAYLFGSQP